MDERRKPINEDAFIADAASGKYSLYELARRNGLSEKQVSRILRGESRPELAGRVRLAEKARGELHSSLLELRHQAALTLGDAMVGKASATALRAAREVLKLVLCPPARTGVPLTFEEKREFSARIKWAFEGQPDEPDEPTGAARPEPPKPPADGRDAEGGTVETPVPESGEMTAAGEQGQPREEDDRPSGQEGQAGGPVEKPEPKPKRKNPNPPINGGAVWW